MVNPLLAHQILRSYHTLKKSSGWPVFLPVSVLYEYTQNKYVLTYLVVKKIIYTLR
jgi:hypothetical protein